MKRRLWSLRCKRTLQRRSARGKKRGVRSGQECGVAAFGTVGPARRSSLLSSAWWTGSSPIPRCGAPRATDMSTRPPRRRPPQVAARGFWIRVWGQRESALEGTGRSDDAVHWAGSVDLGLGLYLFGSTNLTDDGVKQLATLKNLTILDLTDATTLTVSRCAFLCPRHVLSLSFAVRSSRAWRRRLHQVLWHPM